jgi:DHA2 family methylenomycin A resistance protein-like MFS transporter
MSRSAPRLALTGLSLGYFMVLFDTTALTVALPDLARDLGGGVDALAWVTDGYTLTFAGCLLAGGVVADRRGAERTFRAGLVAFGLLSLACAAAPSPAALVAARALLGIAGAVLLPASLSLIAALHADPARRSAAVAAWASISGTALAAGPLLGGALVAWLGWRGIFLVNAPVALVALVVLRGRLPAPARRAARVEMRGQLAVLVAVTGLTFGLIRGGPAGWGGLAVAVLAAVIAVRTERASDVPAVPPALRTSPAFAGVLLGGLVVGGALAGELFATTLQLQQARGLGPVLTGLAFLPLTVPTVLNPPLAARLVARVGPGAPVLGGLLLIATAATALGCVPDGASYAWVGGALALLGLGVSFTLPALTAAAVLAAPPAATGAAGGLFSVARQTGAAIGVAAVAAVIGAGADHCARGHAVLALSAAVAAVAWRLAGVRERRLAVSPRPG